MTATLTPADFSQPEAGQEFDYVLAETLGTDALAVCVLQKDLIVYSNPGCRALFGLAIEAQTTRLPDLAIESDREWLRERLLRFVDEGTGSLRVTFQAQGPHGTPVEIELHAVPTLISGSTDSLAFLFDITERRRHEDQLNFLAFLDPLTGLPNRAMFLDRCRDALIAAHQRDTAFAILQADLDGFKAVNDRHGHAAGDLLLKIVAERLAGCVRGHDIVARQGGDEFALLLPAVGKAEIAQQIAERIILEVSAPIPLGDITVKVGISIGIALYPLHGNDIDTLLSLADRAMYASKEAGRNRQSMAEQGVNIQPVTVEFLTWSETHAVGIDIIDQQHRKLVELVNRLGSELKNGQARERLQATVQELLNFTVVHFQTEEDLMSEHTPQMLEAHRARHQQLLGDVKNFGDDLDRRSMALTMRYLQEWLVRHIDTMDKGLGRALQDQGLH